VATVVELTHVSMPIHPEGGGAAAYLAPAAGEPLRQGRESSCSHRRGEMPGAQGGGRSDAEPTDSRGVNPIAAQSKVSLPLLCHVCDEIPHRGAAGPLLCRVRYARIDLSNRLSESAVWRLCAKRAGQAGIAQFSPHDFRRTVATRLKQAGAPLSDIASFLGHVSTQTTERYFREDKEAVKRRLVDLLKPDGEEKDS
jgi:hypothetical protein